MAKKNKLSIDFAAFAEQAEILEKVGGNLNDTVDTILEESKDLVNAQLHAEMLKHHRTGQTELSIRDGAKVEWEGMTAKIAVGFDIANGGLPSIFLMYGTPRMQKDQQLYNAVYGSSTKRKIKELQSQIFDAAIKKAMGG